jgi:hypothetical protein
MNRTDERHRNEVHRAVYLPPDLAASIDATAARERTSASAILRRLVATAYATSADAPQQQGA